MNEKDIAKVIVDHFDEKEVLEGLARSSKRAVGFLSVSDNIPYFAGEARRELEFHDVLLRAYCEKKYGSTSITTLD